MPSGHTPMNTNRMSCGEAREKLPLYVGGDLDSDVLDCRARAPRVAAANAHDGVAEATLARRELVAAFRARRAGSSRPELWPGIRATLRAEGRLREAPDAPRPGSPARLAQAARAGPGPWSRSRPRPRSCCSLSSAVAQRERRTPRCLPRTRTIRVAGAGSWSRPSTWARSSGGLQRVAPGRRATRSCRRPICASGRAPGRGLRPGSSSSDFPGSNVVPTERVAAPAPTTPHRRRISR